MISMTVLLIIFVVFMAVSCVCACRVSGMLEREVDLLQQEEWLRTRYGSNPKE